MCCPIEVGLSMTGYRRVKCEAAHGAKQVKGHNCSLLPAKALDRGRAGGNWGVACLLMIVAYRGSTNLALLKDAERLPKWHS
jgi:hypothetical protein